MEDVGLKQLFGGIYHQKRVLITGHTGFKGSWLAAWLEAMGASVFGLSLAPESEPNHFDLLSPAYPSYIQDINEREKVRARIQEIRPEIVFHLAAQALVRRSYRDPVETFHTNVIGTAHILDACRELDSLKAIVVVTTDKCYENREWVWPYRENDPLGGKDPYSASKAAAEILATSWRHSFFSAENTNVLLATARAGNVIGGGDWAEDRLIPDIVRAMAKKESLHIRYPEATRPWQHVLEPLSGYLLLGKQLLEGKAEYAEAWNFGPEMQSNLPVRALVEKAREYWPELRFEVSREKAVHEARLLMLDSAKAKAMLQWRNVWDFTRVMKYTLQWYRDFYENNTLNTLDDLRAYVGDARARGLDWATV